MRGRGEVRIRNEVATIKHHEEELEETQPGDQVEENSNPKEQEVPRDSNGEGHGLPKLQAIRNLQVKLANRLKHVARRVKSRQAMNSEARAQADGDNQQTMRAYLKDAKRSGGEHQHDDEICRTMKSGIRQLEAELAHIDLTCSIKIAKLVRGADRHDAWHDGLNEKVRQLQAKERSAKLEHPKSGLRNMCRAVGGPTAAPLLVVKVDSQCSEATGRPIGSLTTWPAQIDGIVRRAWRHIYEGNVQDKQAAAASFCAKHKQELYEALEHRLQPIIEADVQRHFRHGRKTVAGMDSWEPAELALLSDRLCHAVSLMYNDIEAGSEWPKGTERAKAAFLEKEGAVVGEVMSYRVLLIMSALYRKWATIRLDMLQPWVQQWAMPEMFSGTG